MQSSAQLAQVTDRPLSFLDRIGDRPSRVATDLTARRCLQGDDHVDEPLLGPVMKVSAEPTPLLQGGFDDARPRGMNGSCPPAVRLGPALLGEMPRKITTAPRSPATLTGADEYATGTNVPSRR